MHTMRTLKFLARAAFLMALPGAAFAQAYVIMANGQQVPVDRILSRPNGDLVVFRGGQPTDLSVGQYTRAVGVRPAEIDQANALIGQGKSTEAQALLTEVVTKTSPFQSWDVIAGVTLANLMIEANNPDGATRTVETLQRRYGDKAFTDFPALQLVDWKARIAKGRTEGLEDQLGKIILDNSNRPLASVAQLVRGDLKTKRSDLKAALLDYLRTTFFYENESSVQAEALFKVGKTFEALGETANAQRYFGQLKAKFPDSEFAARLK